jgi:glycine dehydrogenase subunit 2
MGIDVLHLNLHKTFSTPHGGGGPGSGPVGIKKHLAPYLPIPTIEKDNDRFYLNYSKEKSIGKVRSFYGNFGIIIRALAYILAVGSKGLKNIAINAVANANYIKAKLRNYYHLPYDLPVMHEVIFSDKNQHKFGVSTMDIAKRLIDYGLHPSTVYFPLIVPGAIMIEPTETESIEELNRFIEAMILIAEEAQNNPQILKDAPHTAPVKRLNETEAARKPVLRWTP